MQLPRFHFECTMFRLLFVFLPHLFSKFEDTTLTSYPNGGRNPKASKVRASLFQLQALRLFRFSNDEVVELLAGSDEVKFLVHRTILCDASKVFTKAFDGQFKENTQKMMKLPEDEAAIFELLVEWLYTGRYDLPKDDPVERSHHLQAVKLFCLAEKYDVRTLKERIVSLAFIAGRNNESSAPGFDSLAYLFDNTTDNSGMRKLLVDWWI